MQQPSTISSPYTYRISIFGCNSTDTTVNTATVTTETAINTKPKTDVNTGTATVVDNAETVVNTDTDTAILTEPTTTVDNNETATTVNTLLKVKQLRLVKLKLYTFCLI